MERSKLTFLSLPLEVRERIYIITGLVRHCAINLEEEATRWSKIRAACERVFDDWSDSEPPAPLMLLWHTPGQNREFGHTPRCVSDIKSEIPDYGEPGHSCIHTRLPLELFQISRKIRRETVYLFYSRNKFIINGVWLGREKKLWLRLDLMKVVEIQLTTCSCVAGHKCPEPADAYYQEYNPCALCHYGCKRGSGEPLVLRDMKSKTTIEDWTTFCESLKEKCSAGLTELCVIADCEDMATALTVVQPLSKGFPMLEHASIRLGQSHNGDLGILAKQTVQKLVGVANRQSTSPTPRTLPMEVLELILQNTDLVTSDYLSWFEPALSDSQKICRYRQKNRIFQGLWRFDDKYHVCCVCCTPSREVCACPSRHAAYSSHICRCWHFPKALFLVSKTFYAMAVKIFCSKNRFMLFELDPNPDSGERVEARRISNGCERLAKPLDFIQTMPQVWSQHIQWLKLRGTNFRWNEGLPDVDPNGYASWESLTSSLKQWPRVDRLTIEFDVSSDYQDWRLGLVIPQGEEDAAWESLWNIIKLFKLPDAHKIYKDFFIRLDYDAATRNDEDARWLRERDMERYLMGEDYDAASRGKYHDKRQYNESLKPKRFIADYDITMRLTDKDLYEP